MEHFKRQLNHIDFPGDPDRCQATRKLHGQCHFKVVPGSKYCALHGGNNAQEAAIRDSIYKFRLAKYQDRFGSLSGSDSIKNLRDEVAILRLLVQKRLDLCSNESDLLMHSTAISRFLNQIQSLAVSCAKVELSLSEVIDSENAVTIVQKLISAIKKHYTEPIDDLLNDLMLLLDRMHNKKSGTIVSNYKLSWQNELNKYLSDEKIVSLRGEIGVLRLIIEELLNQSEDAITLLSNSVTICGHINTVEKLVLSCHKLEQSNGLLLDKEQAIQLANELVTIVGNYIKDSLILEKIAAEWKI